MASAGEEVKLLGLWASPYVMRVMIALNLKGVEYEFLQEVIGSKSELLLKSNPVYKKIPVLIHAGKPVCESMIIVQYIDDVWSSTGPSILSTDPYDCALSRFWTVYVDDKSSSIFGILRGKTEEEKAKAIEKTIAMFQQLEEAFEKCSKGKGFFSGENIGYLDIAIGGLLGWVKVVEKLNGITFLDKEKVPLLAGWAERFCSNDAVKKVIPETGRLIEFAKMRFNAASDN